MALVDAELTPREFTRARFADPAVRELAGRFSVEFDERMTERMRRASLVLVRDGRWTVGLEGRI